MVVKDMTAEQLTELLANTAKDAVSAYVKEAGLDRVDQKHVVIPSSDAGKDEKEQLKLKQEERFGLMAKAIWKKDYITVNTMNEQIKAADPNNITTTTEGGYLVPEATSAEIIGLIPTFGQLRPLVDVGRFPMNISSLKVPKRGTGLTVYYPGEEGAITTTKLTLDLITLASKKAAAMAVLTDELKAFAIVDFVNYIKERAAEAFAMDEDTQGMGVSNTYFTGLFYGSNAYGYSDTSDFGADLNYDQILDMVYSLDQKYLTNAKWLCHRSVVAALRKIKDLDNKPLLVEANAGSLPTMLGYPVVTAEKAPAVTALVSGNAGLLLGNFKNSMIKDRQGMRIDMSTEAVVDATSMFQNDLTAIRFIREWSFHPGLVEGYAALKKA